MKINVCFCKNEGVVSDGCPIHGRNVAQQALLRASASSPIQHHNACDCGTRRGHRRRLKQRELVPVRFIESTEAYQSDVPCEVEMVPDAERCCSGCKRVDTDKRYHRDVDALMCFECRPITGYERLEKLRGKPYGAGESPDADVSALLDQLEASQKQLRNIVEKFDANPIASQEQLARAMFIASNIDEIKKRAEVDSDPCKWWSVTPAFAVIKTMYADPYYARSRAECEQAAERVWAARRCV